MFGAMFVADVHIGNHRRFGGKQQAGLNDRARAVLGALTRAVTEANRTDFDLVVLGDLFDSSSPSPQMLTAALRVLERVTRSTYVIVGNHDQTSTEGGDHALGVLAAETPGNAPRYVIDHPQVLRTRAGVGLFLPYHPTDTLAYLTDAVATALLGVEPRIDFLACHAGVTDEHTPSWLRNAPDAVNAVDLGVLMKRAGIPHAFCGHWHEPRTWSFGDFTITQVGTLAPTGFADEGVKGRMVPLGRVSDGLKASAYFSIPGPRFYTVIYPHLAPALPSSDGSTDYVRVRCSPDDLDEAHRMVARLPRPDLVVVEVVAPEVERPGMDAATIAAVRDVTTLDRAVREYVAKAPLDEGVDRDAVLTSVLGHVARGGAP